MEPWDRRLFLKVGLGVAAAWPASKGLLAAADAPASAALWLDATTPPAPPRSGVLHAGTGRNPRGRELSVDSRSLRLDDKPWLPVMGEIHYSRYPEAEWRDELLKMKMGGIDLVATYVFWIHHEEVEGRFDWSGRRSLRRFVEQCHELHLQTIVRCGPWCHGEVRNGGLPDWVLDRGLRLRSDDPGYLRYARRLYAEIAAQLHGLLWKDGGPVVGIQCENEYGGPAEHLVTLKQMARDVGLDVPLYTRTGWPKLKTPMPSGELLPLFGSYAEGFWDRELTPMPGKYGEAFLFKLARTDAAVATDQLGPREADDGDEIGGYPYFCCEIGGGMMPSYHRRIRMRPADVESTAMVKLGSGNNLQGYYMFHGGTNPEGALSTLQESQATQFWNDMPVKSYDFQAPLGEFGQVRRHYHLLRRAHLFVRDFGALLAAMPARLPKLRPASPADRTTLRWAARCDGDSGFAFVNNYQRLQAMPAQQDVQFEVQLARGPLRFPRAPFTVPADVTFFWPFNFPLADARLVYATAQPVCRIEDQATTYLVFAETRGVAAEFLFGRNVAIELASGTAVADAGGRRVHGLTPGAHVSIRARTPGGRRFAFVLLDEAQSLTCWKATFQGRERLFLTRAGLTVDGPALRLTALDPADLAVSVFPAPPALTVAGSRAAGTIDGLFRRFTAPATPVARLSVVVETVLPAGPLRTIRNGSAGVAEAPADADFEHAAVWRLRLPPATDPARDLLLSIRYVGDVARLYLGGRLLLDNFYNGDAFEVGLARYAPEIYTQELLLKVLPLQKTAPLYLADDARPEFGDAASALTLLGVDVLERHEARFTAV